MLKSSQKALKYHLKLFILPRFKLYNLEAPKNIWINKYSSGSYWRNFLTRCEHIFIVSNQNVNIKTHSDSLLDNIIRSFHTFHFKVLLEKHWKCRQSKLLFCFFSLSASVYLCYCVLFMHENENESWSKQADVEMREVKSRVLVKDIYACTMCVYMCNKGLNLIQP